MYALFAVAALLLVPLLWRGYLRSYACRKFESSHQLWVGWTRRQYAVGIEEVDALIEELIDRFEPRYPLARQALVGCTIIFRCPTWIQWWRLRRVEGEQDDLFITVGWRPCLELSALQHELAHRILQVCAGDPSEDQAHQILAKFGL